jgi:hypothetical protein
MDVIKSLARKDQWYCDCAGVCLDARRMGIRGAEGGLV